MYHSAFNVILTALEIIVLLKLDVSEDWSSLDPQRIMYLAFCLPPSAQSAGFSLQIYMIVSNGVCDIDLAEVSVRCLSPFVMSQGAG